MMGSLRFTLLTLMLLTAVAATASQPGYDYENRLLQTLDQIAYADFNAALAASRDFIDQYPHSKLGQLLYADLLMAKASVLTGIGAGITPGADNAARLDDLTLEIKQRLAHNSSAAYQDKIPASLVKLAENQRHFIVIDLSASRLFVFSNQQGTPVLQNDYYITIGLKGIGKQKRGDQKTPIGIYHVTRYIDGEELPDLYGSGAFPINYPNTWDRRHQRTGSGIWLHGTPSHTYNRAPWSSDGCVVLSNNDLQHIAPFVSPQDGTPVIITRSIDWISAEQWQQNQVDLLQTMTRWIDDWESNDHQRYMSHYSQREFLAYGRDYKKWEGHKRWVNRDKSDINIKFSNLNIYHYPGDQDLVMMQFDQDYSSNTLELSASKELFWRKHEDQWQIVYEGFIEKPSANTLQAANDSSQ